MCCGISVLEGIATSSRAHSLNDDSDPGHHTKTFERAEILSRKYLRQKRKNSGKNTDPKVNGGGKAGHQDSSSNGDHDAERKATKGLDSWLFGEDMRATESNDDAHEEDEDPPVLFTLNMSDLRSLIGFMYSYHDLLRTINLEYEDESFQLKVENRIWPYLAAVIDAYVDGEDGARRQMQVAAQNCLKTQGELGANAVDVSINGLLFTHTPADLWEMLNAHTAIAGLGEKNNERLQLKVMIVIAGIVNASVKSTVEEALRHGKDWGYQYVCAIVNDCSQHVESLDSIMDSVSSEPVRKRLQPIYDNLTLGIYDYAQKCTSILISLALSDLNEQVRNLFTEKHDIMTIKLTIEDYSADFKRGLQDFYFIKLQALFLQHTITVYLSQLARFVEDKVAGRSKSTMSHVNSDSLASDSTILRGCFGQYLDGPPLEVPLRVLSDCIKFASSRTEEEDISALAGDIVRQRGMELGRSVFKCIKTLSKLRQIGSGLASAQSRHSNSRDNSMLCRVAESISEMAERPGAAVPEGEGIELGRDGQIYINAFPASADTNFTNNSLLLLDLEDNLLAAEESPSADISDVVFEDPDADKSMENLEDDLENDAALTDIDIAQKSQLMGEKRRITMLVKAGQQASSLIGTDDDIQESTFGGGIEGWLEKKSPSHNLWQLRYFKLSLDSKDNVKGGGELSWHKKENAAKQNSIAIKEIKAPPTILSSPRALTIHALTGHVRLRKMHDGNEAEWIPIVMGKKRGGEGDFFEFMVQGEGNREDSRGGGGRDYIVRTDDVDVLLKWVNTLTAVWRRFNESPNSRIGGAEEEAGNWNDSSAAKHGTKDKDAIISEEEPTYLASISEIRRPSREFNEKTDFLAAGSLMRGTESEKKQGIVEKSGEANEVTGNKVTEEDEDNLLEKSEKGIALDDASASTTSENIENNKCKLLAIDFEHSDHKETSNRSKTIPCCLII